MANTLKVSIGTFMKKTIGTLGVSDGKKIPFLPKTLAKLVYMDDGKPVSEEITSLKNGDYGISTTQTFNSFDEYEKALEDGTAKNSSMYIVMDDATSANIPTKSEEGNE